MGRKGRGIRPKGKEKTLLTVDHWPFQAASQEAKKGLLFSPCLCARNLCKVQIPIPVRIAPIISVNSCPLFV